MTIDPSGFIKNDRVREYVAVFEVTGELRVAIEADSVEEARAKARAMLDEESFGIELDEVLHCRVDRVRKCPAMYLVTRDGRQMQVSLLEDGDTPRKPDDGGF